MKTFIKTLLIITLTSSCSNSDTILKGHDFDKGDWILVNVNHVENTLEIIDEESVLKNNKNGIKVTSMGDCTWTTCDGSLKLYNNGILVARNGYLARTRIYLFESKEIRKAYKNAIEWTINPKDENEFQSIWDSLKIEDCYPTKYHTQPADKDIIWTYKIE